MTRTRSGVYPGCSSHGTPGRPQWRPVPPWPCRRRGRPGSAVIPYWAGWDGGPVTGSSWRGSTWGGRWAGWWRRPGGWPSRTPSDPSCRYSTRGKGSAPGPFSEQREPCWLLPAPPLAGASTCCADFGTRF